MATPKNQSQSKKNAPKIKRNTNQPVAKTYGAGEFPLPTEAAKRLEPRTTPYTVSAPAMTDKELSPGSGFDSVVTPGRLFYYKMTRFSPIKILSAELVVHYLDLFEMGYIRWMALLEWYIAQRDPIIQTVMNKRFGSVKRLKWQIVVDEDLDPSLEKESAKHKDALFKFYQGARATNAVDLNLNAGVSTLFEQMMTSVGYKWAVHEIIWKPEDDGNLTARFNFIPLWFFENRTGKLRFTEMDYQLDGRDLKDGSFMITTGSGIMEPCTIAYLYKQLALKWWIAYIEGHASPLKVGITNATRNSANWESMKKALQQAVDSILLSKDEDVKKVDIAAAGELPYQPMVEEMNRMMATMWRGADLSTMSAKASNAGQGALLQGKEEYFLQCDDAARITETMNFQVDPQVIGWHFGEGTKPLASFKLVVPPNIEAATDITIITAFISWGLADKLGQKQLLEHFGWSERHDDDDPIEPMQVQDQQHQQQMDEMKTYQSGLEAANQKWDGTSEERIITAANEALAGETAEALRPLRDGVVAILGAKPDDRVEAYRVFRRSLPRMLANINRDPANRPALEKLLTSSWFLGLARAAKKRGVFR